MEEIDLDYPEVYRNTHQVASCFASPVSQVLAVGNNRKKWMNVKGWIFKTGMWSENTLLVKRSFVA